MEGFENVIFHEAFYKKQGVDLMKNIMEFNFPEDANEHYNALNGRKYRELMVTLRDDLVETIKQAHGTDEAVYLSAVLKRIEDLAIDLDVKLNRK
jgi:hypothetical protein